MLACVAIFGHPTAVGRPIMFLLACVRVRPHVQRDIQDISSKLLQSSTLKNKREKMFIFLFSLARNTYRETMEDSLLYLCCSAFLMNLYAYS